MKEGTKIPPLKYSIRYLESSIGQQREPGEPPAPMLISDHCLPFILSSFIYCYKGNIRNANIKSRSSHLAYGVLFPQKNLQRFSVKIYISSVSCTIKYVT